MNLLDKYGGQYRVSFDRAYDPKGRPRDILDEEMMEIRCERGVIYPFDSNGTLAVEVDGRPITSRRLAALDVCTLYQDGDNEQVFLFDAGDFDAVAEIVLPRRRRQVSMVQRQAARGRMHILNQQNPSPGHSQRALTHSEQKSD